jgi:hypothetical protein
MTVSALVAILVTNAFPGWRSFGRRSWCTEQRRRLHARGRRVLWVHDGEKMPWALWGADNGFFEVEWAGRLPYLRALAVVG